MFDLERIRNQTSVAILDYHPQLPSTSDRASDLVRQSLAIQDRDGYPKLVITDCQTAGRGQRHRKWWSGKGSLTFSWVTMALADGARRVEMAPIAAGVAAARAIEAQSGLAGIEIKWPNDLIVDGRKIAGILVETIASTRGPVCIVGVGVNVNNVDVSRQQIVSLDDRIAGTDASHPLDPASIEMITGRQTPVTELLISIVKQLQLNFERLEGQSETIIAQANERLAYRGEMVRIHRAGDSDVIGICSGLSNQGGLVIDVAGTQRTIFSGTVSLSKH